MANVTVIVRHRIDAGKERAFDAWMEGITEACSTFEGYVDTEVVRASGAAEDERVCIFRFDSIEHLDGWMDSSVRRTWLERASEFGSEPGQVHRYEGIDFWFSRPQGRATPPPRHKMAIATFAVIWPLVHFVPRAISASLPAPSLVQEACSVAAIVLLMTYAVMPLATRALGPWLFARRGRPERGRAGIQR